MHWLKIMNKYTAMDNCKTDGFDTRKLPLWYGYSWKSTAKKRSFSAVKKPKFVSRSTIVCGGYVAILLKKNVLESLKRRVRPRSCTNTIYRDDNDESESSSSQESGSSPNDTAGKITNENAKENLRPASDSSASTSTDGNTPNC